MSYSTINAHRGMALDTTRNEAYYRALRQTVSPSSTVLDLGAGVGILGMMAAQLGARLVYLAEPEDIVYAVAPSIPENIRSRIRVVQERAERLQLPEQVDVIVSVFTGNFLLAEDLLPELFSVRDRFLSPTGRLIPDAGRMVTVPVNSPSKHAELVTSWSSLSSGIDLSPAQAFAANSIHYIREGWDEFRYLSRPALLCSLDFYSAGRAECDASTTFVSETNALCHGLLGWFDMRLGDRWISTGPEEPRMHWAVAYLPLCPPLQVTEGESLDVRLTRPERGHWTWSMQARAGGRRHSTFLGSPLAPETIRKSATGYKPRCSVEGRLIKTILECFDHGLTVAEIQERAYAAFGHSYGDRESINRAIDRLVARYG